jgi:hypothetical protein
VNPAISGLSSPAARFASSGSAPVPLRFGADMTLSGFPELIDVTSLTQQEVVRLYRAYVEEWGSNEDAVRSQGLARCESRTVALCLMKPKTRSGNPRR